MIKRIYSYFKYNFFDKKFSYYYLFFLDRYYYKIYSKIQNLSYSDFDFYYRIFNIIFTPIFFISFCFFFCNKIISFGFFCIFFLPVFCIFFLIFFERNIYWVRFYSVYFSFIIFICCVLLTSVYIDNNYVGYYGFVKFNINYPYFNSIIFGIDNFSVVFIILTSFLTFISISSVLGYNELFINRNNYFNYKFSYEEKIYGIFNSEKYFFILLFIVEFFSFGVFISADLFSFFIFFESIIIPMLFIIGKWGSRIEFRANAAYLFFYYTFATSLGVLFSVVYVYNKIGGVSIVHFNNSNFSLFENCFLFFFLFLSFSTKMPIYPFHLWLPEAHVEAPTAGSIMLAGVLLKLGSYGIVRWCFNFFSVGCDYFCSFIIFLSLVSIIYSSVSALFQLDVKRIVAYTSISHMGFVLFSLITFSQPSLYFEDHVISFSGALFQMLTHGLISASLFYSIGVLYNRYETRSVIYYGGLFSYMPVFSSFFFIFCLANMSFPSTCGFPGEFLILCGIYKFYPSFIYIVMISVFINGFLNFWLYSRIMLGKINDNYIIGFMDVTNFELFIMFILFFTIFFFGFFPDIILNFTKVYFFKYIWLNYYL